MHGAGPAVAQPITMQFTRLGFTMYRLEAYQTHDLHEPAYVAVQLLRSRNTMSIFGRR